MQSVVVSNVILSNLLYLKATMKTSSINYNLNISKLFNKSIIKYFDNDKYKNEAKSLLISSGVYDLDDEWQLDKALSLAYEHLKANYRSEYIYKNEIVNQILLKNHTYSSATLLKEVYSDRSIADLVIVNGHTVAYEIKTELDSFDRLDKQLKAYCKLYDFVNVVTYPSAIDKVQAIVEGAIGILVLNDDGRLQVIRKPKSLKSRFDANRAVYTLRQSELVSAYEAVKGKLPPMGSALVLSFCNQWFTNLPRITSRKVFKDSLKSRRVPSYQFDLANQCSYSLRMALMSKKITKKNCLSIKEKFGIFE